MQVATLYTGKDDLMTETNAACIGLYRSGTTWTYNVISQLLNHNHDVDQFYADNIHDFFRVKNDKIKYFVIKSHNATDELLRLLKLSNTKIIINVRDPVYCINSMVRQFNVDFNYAFEHVLSSIRSVEMVAKNYDCLLLRYEDGLEKNENLVETLATYLEQDLTQSQLNIVATKNTKSSINTYIKNLLKQNYFDGTDPANQFHEKTHWHPNHIGPNISGHKSLILNDAEIYQIIKATSDFRAKYDYIDKFHRAPIERRTVINFRKKDHNYRYLVSGFDQPEDWGVWSVGPRSVISIPICPTIKSLSMFFSFKLCTVFRYKIGMELMISINNKVHFFESGYEAIEEFNRMSAHDIVPDKGFLNITIDIVNPTSFHDLSISSEARKLGVGLMHIALLNIERN